MSNLELVNQAGTPHSQLGLNPSGVVSSGAGQANQATGRQAAWLLELERALLQANQFHSSPEVAKAVAPALAKAAPDQHLQPKALNFGAQLAPTQAQPGQLGAAPTGTNHVSDPSHAHPTDHARHPALRQLAQPVAQSNALAPVQSAQAAPTPESTQADQTKLASMAMGSAPGWAAPEVFAPGGFQFDPGSAKSVPGSFSAFHPYVMGSHTLANVALEPVPAPMPALAAPNRTGLPLFLATPRPEHARGEPVQESGQEPGHASSRPNLDAQTGATKEYERRQLHLYQHSEEVQAWLRDPDLSPAQIQKVAQALSAELGAGGLKLTALSVNGHKVIDTVSESESESAHRQMADETKPDSVNDTQNRQNRQTLPALTI